MKRKIDLPRYSKDAIKAAIDPVQKGFFQDIRKQLQSLNLAISQAKAHIVEKKLSKLEGSEDRSATLRHLWNACANVLPTHRIGIDQIPRDLVVLGRIVDFAISHLPPKQRARPRFNDPALVASVIEQHIEAASPQLDLPDCESVMTWEQGEPELTFSQYEDALKQAGLNEDASKRVAKEVVKAKKK